MRSDRWANGGAARRAAPEQQLPTLRRQTLDHPITLAVATVAQPIVKAIVPLLPELEALGGQPEASPIRRQRQLVGAVLLLQLIQALLERPATADRLTLRRSERAELAPARAAAHVGGR